jgi:hypothetical protein
MWATPFLPFFVVPGAVAVLVFFVLAAPGLAPVFGFDRSKLEPNSFEKKPPFAGALLALGDFELLPAPDVDFVEPPEL